MTRPPWRRRLFAPPPLPSSAAPWWVLGSAFGPAGSAGFGPFDPEEVLRAAGRLGLAARIGSRVPAEVLEREVGTVAAAELRAATRAAAIRHLTLQALLRDVAREAATEGVPLILTKFAALDALGVVRPGARPATDVDVLVPEDGISRLHSRLLGGGLVPCGGDRAVEHAVRSLRAPSGGVVELHRTLPGVGPPTGRSFDARALLERGLVRSLPGVPGSVFVPVTEVLAAHVLVHGFASHAGSGNPYPVARALADLADVLSGGFADGTDDEAIAALCGRSLAPADAVAVLRLARLLASGGSGGLREEGRSGLEEERLLLRFLLGKALDDAYDARLALAPRATPGDRPAALRLLGEVWWALALTDERVDAIYGPQASRASYALRKLLRPVDLGRRAIRYATGRGRAASPESGNRDPRRAVIRPPAGAPTGGS